MTMTVGSLFSGIGGLDLGLERAGMTVRWNSEIDPYCCRVLAKHWPHVPNLGDVTTPDWSTVEPVELICGGFPCQDVSHAGARAGIDGVRSGLWAHFAEGIRTLRPRYVVVENVTGLLVRGLGRVLGDLAAIGYDAQWDCLPAAAVGAPQLRARVWLLAYPREIRSETLNALQAGWPQPELRAWWDAEPAVDRVAHGVSRRLVGRLHEANGALGNAVVPQVAEHIGRLILDADQVTA